jgi:hypothetical protein
LCSIITDGTGDTFQVLKVTAQLNPFYQNKVPRNWLSMKYDPGNPVYITKIICPKSPVVTLKEPRWREIYNVERHDFSGTLVEDDWIQIALPGTFAFKAYEPPPNTVQAQENSNLTLKHTPQ